MAFKLSYFPLLLIIIINSFTAFAGSEDAVRILYVNSYHNGFYWSDDITESLKTSFKKHPNYILNIEYLDGKRDPDYYKDSICINYFERKYNSVDFDIVITSDNDALDFILLYKDLPLFKDKKVVACGISNTEFYAQYEDIYIIKEKTTFEETFEIMVSFFPKMKQLVFITDNLKSGQIYIEQVSKLIKDRFPGIKLHIMDCVDPETLADSIRKYSFPSVLFYSSVNNDCKGQTINEYDVAKIIASNARAPLFSGHYASTTEGFIGGCMTTGTQNGKAAAKLIVDILEGNETTIKKLTTPEVTSIFNYDQLTRFKIPAKLIPLGSVLLNKPESFWLKSKKILVIGGLIILQLLIVIGLLYRSVWTQKRYEKELLVAMDKAKESNQLKSIFLENVSHEMRTPLNSIVGFSDVLMESVKDEKLKSYVKIISENSLNLTHMINHVFDFSLLKSHKVSLDISQFNLKELLNDLTDPGLIANQIGEKKLSIVKDFDPNFPERLISSDKEKIYQVINHLLKNAIKFTTSGKIYITYRFIDEKDSMLKQFFNLQKSQEVHFRIMDTGKGITEKDLDLIFEPFRQANESTINANRGLGLGLSISKSIIDLLKGTIWVESKPDEGTVINFIIPTNLEEIII